MLLQQMMLDSLEITWEIDQTAIGRIVRWAQRNPEILVRDLEGMRTYFPHWLLLGTQAGRIVYCGACKLACVPMRGALRCPACNTECLGDGLLWAGELPALVRPEPQFSLKRLALQNAGWNEICVHHQAFLRIPLSAAYPTEWPNLAPTIRYAPRWLDAAGLPHAHASYHLIGNGQACIYGYGEWQAQPIYSVLQQRMVNHAASLLKIMAGVPPNRAFIGKAHGGMNDDR